MRLFGKNDSKEISLHVEGMRCSMCVKNLERGLKETDGVEKVQVSLEEKKAVVSYNEKKISVEQLIAAVSEIGYTASLE